MRKIFIYVFLSLMWFKYFTIIPKPIHVILQPRSIVSTTEESSTSNDPASNDTPGDSSTDAPGDSGDF